MQSAGGGISSSGGCNSNGSVTLSTAGSSGSCAFTNQAVANLTVSKQRSEERRSFTFSAGGGIGTFTLVMPTGGVTTTAFTVNVPATVTVSEFASAGFSSSGGCNSNGSVTLSTAGSSGSCAFTNQAVANLTVSKQTNRRCGSFTFSAGGGIGTFTLVMPTGGVTTTAFTVNVPATVTVSEFASAGFSSSGGCNSNRSEERRTAGSSGSCAFTNQAVANLTVSKQTNGGGGSFTFSAGGGIGTFTLVMPTGGVTTTAFTVNVPATVTVSEFASAGFSSSGGCNSNGSVTLSTAGSSGSCAFTNQAVANLTVSKQTNRRCGSFTFSAGGGIGTFTLVMPTGGVTTTAFTVNVPATVTVSEFASAGFSSSGGCNSNGSVTLTTPGSSGSCPFTNQAVANLTVSKQTNGGGGSFTFSAGGRIGTFTLVMPTGGATNHTYTVNVPATVTVSEFASAGFSS